MVCKNCGTQAYDTDKYCSNCGMPLKDDFNQSWQSTTNNKEDKKNKIISSLLIIFIFLALVVGTIVFINRDTIFNTYKGKRTIMLYMIGSDLESKYLAASIDIEEIINSNVDLDNVNILIYTGGAKNWHREEVNSEENAIFEVTSEEIKKVKSYEQKDMGDANTLAQFLNYGYDNYKAENYSLILWDHGGGPIYGYGYDEYNTKNALTLLELKQALKNSPFNEDRQLEFIGFDACLMATVEVAHILSPYANYMIASQEVEPGAGWNYSFLSDVSTDTTTYELGKMIVDSYSLYYKDKKSNKGTSLSLLKLNKINSLEEELNNLFSEVDENLKLDFSIISRSRSYTKTFGKVSSNGYDLVDLYDLLDKLPLKYSDKIETLKSAIDELVIYQKTDLLGTNGISIYFPYDNKKDIEKVMYLYKQFNFADEYTAFIDNFSLQLTGTRLYNWTLDKNVPTVDDKEKIQVELPQEVVDNYSKAGYIIFEKMQDDYYTPVFTGSDIELNGNILSTQMGKKALVAKDGRGNEIYITALESEKGEDYTKYIIPGTIQRWDDDLLTNFEILPIYLQLVVDSENPNGKITGAIEVVSDDDNQTSPKVAIDIADWKVIQLLNYKYKIFDDNGNFTTDWTSSSEITGFEANITDSFELEFKDLPSDREYYALFRVADSQGNIYNTNIVEINR